MRLREWIALQGGVAAAARGLGVSKATIYGWLKGRREPNCKMIRRIVAKTHGVVSHKEIVEGF